MVCFTDDDVLGPCNAHSMPVLAQEQRALPDTSACRFFGLLFIVNEQLPRAEDRYRATWPSDDSRELKREKASGKTGEMTQRIANISIRQDATNSFVLSFGVC